MKIGRLLLRVIVGGLFVGHGTQKLFGWFGGHGLEATGQAFEQMGLKPGRTNALAAGAAEAGGGTLLAAGLATPVGAAAVTGAMLVAIREVHLGKGPWVSEGGWEYNVVLIAAALMIAEAGPGTLSLDALLGKERSGIGWGLFALAGGLLGAAAQQELLVEAEPEEAPAATAAAESNGSAESAMAADVERA